MSVQARPATAFAQLNRDSLQTFILNFSQDPLPLPLRIWKDWLCVGAKRVRVEIGVGRFVIGIVKWGQPVWRPSELIRIGRGCALIVVHR
jgi:hypothetical protein